MLMWKTLCLTTILWATGCAATSRPPRPAKINHLVFIVLTDSADVQKLIDACDTQLPFIPGVVAYHCGQHRDFDRTNIDSAYDVALSIGFDSAAAYATYVAHPDHVALLTAWGPRVQSIRIHDVVDETP